MRASLVPAIAKSSGHDNGKLMVYINIDKNIYKVYYYIDDKIYNVYL